MALNTRQETLQAFLRAAQRGFQDGSPDQKTTECLSRVFDALQNPAPFAPTEPTRVSTSDLLGDALEPARRAGGALEQLAQRVLDLNPLLSWKRRAGSAPTASAGYADGHANAMIVGPGGLEDRHDVWVGMSLMVPGVRYPVHRHSPEEIYLVLTDGKFLQGESEWFTPGVGGMLYNEPNILHSMEASPTTPFLALWCLFDARH